MLFERVRRTVGFFDLHLLIYAYHKLGKTALATHFRHDGREPLLIMTEDGAKGLDARVVRIMTWDDFLKVKRHILANVKEVREQHSVIVIDLVAELDDMCTAHVLKQYGATYLGDLSHGRGWAIQRDMFRAGLRDLFDVLGLVFVAHAKEREVDYQGETITKIAPVMSAAAYEHVTGKVDAIGYIVPGTKVQPPRLTFRPTARLAAGSRFQELMQQDYAIEPRNMAATVAELVRAMTKPEQQ